MTEKTRTITLTDRAPIRIVEAQWPVIASASGDSWGATVDPARHHQALHRGELDRYWLTVRQHADGRTIVYAVVDGSQSGTGVEDWRGGVLIPAAADVAGAIRQVGDDAGLPDLLIRECIASLPPTDLVGFPPPRESPAPGGFSSTH